MNKKFQPVWGHGWRFEKDFGRRNGINIDSRYMPPPFEVETSKEFEDGYLEGRIVSAGALNGLFVRLTRSSFDKDYVVQILKRFVARDTLSQDDNIIAGGYCFEDEPPAT